MAVTIEVSWVRLQIPDHVPAVPEQDCAPLCCGADCACDRCGAPPHGPHPPRKSPAPVNHATGEMILHATDLHAAGFGVPWGHTRSFANRLTQPADAGNGYNCQVQQWTYLAFPDADTVVVMGAANAVLWFDRDGSAFVQRHGGHHTLRRSGDAYLLVAEDGSVTEYDATTGVLRRHLDPAGNTLQVVGTTANGFNFTEVQRSYTAGGSTTTESFLYAYDDSTAAFPRLSSVTLRRRVNAGAWTNVLRALYTYYGSADAFGANGDLKTVVTQTWDGSAWAATGTTLYRY